MTRIRLCAAALLIVQSVVQAQSLGMKPIDAPAEPNAVSLDTGSVENALAPESWFTFNNQKTVRNVQQATLTPVLPDKTKATGAAVIVAPGGGFFMLSMENEGWPVARWLADRGIAAFVLKYRLKPTGASLENFQKELGQRFREAGPLATPADAVADAEAALRLVRSRSNEWGVDPARIGMLGFSAGAMTTLSVALKATEGAPPAFIAPVYGSMNSVTVPASAPPMYVVLASDDPLFANKGFGLIESWMAAKRPVELHLYQRGGHGFGMGRVGSTTLDWLEGFRRWMESNGFLSATR